MHTFQTPKATPAPNRRHRKRKRPTRGDLTNQNWAGKGPTNENEWWLLQPSAGTSVLARQSRTRGKLTVRFDGYPVQICECCSRPCSKETAILKSSMFHPFRSKINFLSKLGQSRLGKSWRTLRNAKPKKRYIRYYANNFFSYFDYSASLSANGDKIDEMYDSFTEENSRCKQWKQTDNGHPNIAGAVLNDEVKRART